MRDFQRKVGTKPAGPVHRNVIESKPSGNPIATKMSLKITGVVVDDDICTQYDAEPLIFVSRFGAPREKRRQSVSYADHRANREITRVACA